MTLQQPDSSVIISVLAGALDEDRIERGMAGTAVTGALSPLSIFVQLSCSSLQQPHTMNKEQYPANRDVLKVTGFHK
jgi:hypothetical protein